MQNETSILIYQTEDGNTKIDVRLENETVWMTQKAIAELFQTSPQNITLHIKNILKYLDEKEHSCYFTVTKEEGSREIKRNILHYSLDVLFNITLRGQHFEQFNRFIHFLKDDGNNKDFLTVVPIKEREFGELLIKSLEGIVEVIPQHRIDRYIVDFYLPDLRLVVEYDEKYHSKQLEEDQKRQSFIEKELRVNFIRVKEGFELEGVNNIFKHLFSLRKS